MAVCSLAFFGAVSGCATHPAPPTVLSVEFACSPIESRTVVAKLTWNTDKALYATQRLDLTADRQGFKNGLFASLPSVSSGGMLQKNPLSEQQSAERLLHIEAQFPSFDEKTGQAGLLLRGFELGIMYRFRIVSQKSPTVSLFGREVAREAPVCIIKQLEPGPMRRISDQHLVR